MNKTVVPGGETYACSKTEFVCAKAEDYTCGQGSKVGITHLCGDQTEDFDCKITFTCKKKEEVEDIFDCFSFDCGVNGDKTNDKFDCNADYDFFCGGPEFDCVDTFECTAEHIFLCSNEFTCEDVFYCKAGDECKPVPPAKYVCVPSSDYNALPPEDDDAGDFLCGETDHPRAERFDCKNTFKCLAYDDFSCLTLAKFTCGDGKGVDNFDCSPTKEHPGVQFHCRTTFACYVDHVDCGTPDAYGGCTGETKYIIKCLDPDKYTV